MNWASEVQAFVESRRAGGHLRRDLLSLAAKVTPMAARGALLRPRLAGADGTPLIGRGVRVREPHHIRIGHGVVIEDYAELQGASVGGLTIGNRVSIGAFAMIRPSGYYGRALGEGLYIGDDSNVGAYCYVGCSGLITIGQRVLMGPGVRLFAEDHNFGGEASLKAQGVSRAPICIADDVWLASGCTITSGVVIGTGSVVAAGSVVTHDIPPRSLAAGVPARVLKEIET